MRTTEQARFDEAVHQIRLAFPSLHINVDREQHDYWDAVAEIPQQRGLDFDVLINLQNADELHLNVGKHFWVEWFPCGDEKVFSGFVASVTGLLSGDYRIVEASILGNVVSGELQRPDSNAGWRSVARWSNLGALLPLPRRRTILQNSSPSKAAA